MISSPVLASRYFKNSTDSENHFPFIKHEFLLDVRQGQRWVYGTTSLNRDGLLYQREKIRKIYQEIAEKKYLKLAERMNMLRLDIAVKT